MKFSVIFVPKVAFASSKSETFESVKDAKKWMAKAFNNTVNNFRQNGIDIQWSWNEKRTSKCFGFCNIKGFGTWKIVKLVEDK